MSKNASAFSYDVLEERHYKLVIHLNSNSQTKPLFEKEKQEKQKLGENNSARFFNGRKDHLVIRVRIR